MNPANPWLNVPLSEYEAHMSSGEVRQLAVLSDLFGEAVALRRPASLAILGIAGGNGLERIDPQITTRIVGVDLNESYLDAVRLRFARLSGLETHRIDLATHLFTLEPVELVHAALVFEHAGVERCLENALSLVAPGGALSVILQLPSESGRGAVVSIFASIENLRPHFSLVDPGWFRDKVERRGFQLIHEKRVALPAGKSFWMAIFTTAGRAAAQTG